MNAESSDPIISPSHPPGFSPRSPTRVHRLILSSPFSSRSIISYGLIVYAKDTQRWVLIQRKHSAEFLLFIRGFYRITYLPLLLAQITQNESEIIRRCLDGGPDEFRRVYLEELRLEESTLPYALIRMAESRTIALRLLHQLRVESNQLSWSWPKGRLCLPEQDDIHSRETPFSCAKREFVEEVEITLPPPVFITDSYLSTYFHTLTGKNIESRFWIYIIPHEVPIAPVHPHHPEVSNRLWADTPTCARLLRESTLFTQVQEIVNNLVSGS